MRKWDALEYGKMTKVLHQQQILLEIILLLCTDLLLIWCTMDLLNRWNGSHCQVARSVHHWYMSISIPLVSLLEIVGLSFIWYLTWFGKKILTFVPFKLSAISMCIYLSINCSTFSNCELLTYLSLFYLFIFLYFLYFFIYESKFFSWLRVLQSSSIESMSSIIDCIHINNRF